MCFWQHTLILSTGSSYQPLGVHLKSCLFNPCSLSFPEMQNFTGRIFKSTQHWLIFDFSVSTHRPVANVFKIFTNVHHHHIASLAPWVSHHSKSFPITVQVSFFRTFLLRLDYNLIHTKRTSCKKKDTKQLCRVQGSTSVSESEWKILLSSQLTRATWNTNTCSIRHWTRRCSTEEQ